MKRLGPDTEAARHLASGRYRIRSIGPEEMAAVTVPWMRAEGWNPGRHDARTFPLADPGGFLLGELDGEPVATVSGVRYDDHFGFIGCYIVAGPHRGRGYGMAIHEAARRRLEGCTQGGDGVLENVEIYRQIGRVYAYRNARYEGVRRAGDAGPALALVEAREVDFTALAQLDRACFPAPRVEFLKGWVAQPEAFALARLREGEPGVVDGYGVIRPCFRGWKIGPLFARDAAVAEAVFRGLVTGIPCGEPYVLDIAEPNEAARALVGRHGMSEVFATARMYTGPFPDVRLDWIYGVTTFELG